MDDDFIVRRDLQFILPVHSPLLHTARPSLASPLQEYPSGAASTITTRTQILATPIQQQQQQQQQLNSPYVRMCAQLERFVDRETELADELLMLSTEEVPSELTPELERARLGCTDDCPQTISKKQHSSIPSGSTRSLWLGNLDPTLTESDIFAAFSPFGQIEMIRLLPAKECAFVNYYCLEDALEARDRMNGCALGNLILRIGFGKIDSFAQRSDNRIASSASCSASEPDSRSICKSFQKRFHSHSF
jgi:hypothetical protein